MECEDEERKLWHLPARDASNVAPLTTSVVRPENESVVAFHGCNLGQRIGVEEVGPLHPPPRHKTEQSVQVS